jgi:phospholipid/cholesterol/gamma-HCH transport system substrate-binding protein
MQLEDGGVAVTLWIDEDHPLPSGSQAQIKSQGVMGEKSVDIHLGPGPQLLESGQSISGLYQPDFTQVVSQVGNVGDGLGEILVALRSLLEDTSQGGLRQAISEVGGTSHQLGDLVSRNAERLDETIAHLHEVSSALASMDAGQQPWTILPNLEDASQDLAVTARRLRDFSASLDSLMQPTFEGHSTLGKLLSDPALYRDCRVLMGHLDSLVLDIRQNPQRYVKIEIF